MPATVRVPLRDYPAQRIALIKPSALGDIVHCLPVLTALRQRYPDATITWVVNRGYEALIRGHPDLNATLPFDRHATRRGVMPATLAYLDWLRRFRARRFDLVLDLQGLFRTGVMCLASGAARRVGLLTAREGAGYAYTDVVPVENYEALHAVDRYWLVAEALGAGANPKTFTLPRSDEAQRWVDDLLANQPRPWLVVGPGSRWLTKRWLPEHFAVLTRLALERFGGTAIFVGGNDEQAISDSVARQLGNAVVDVTGRTSLPQLTALLGVADVVLANDTGPMHLAVALGRPVVAPYTCTKPALCGPYQVGGAVATTVWCRGSYLKRCARLECMDELTPARLWPVLREVLERWEHQQRRSA